MKKAIVVGSGAGGATAAKELQGHFEVTVIEAGRQFHPYKTDMPIVENLKRSGLLFNERLIQPAFPAMKISRTGDMVLVRGQAYGGSTTLSCGNALRMDGALKALGINLDAEFSELTLEIPVSDAHYGKWSAYTRQAYDICESLKLSPRATPKMVSPERCTGCGRCVMGCPRGAKWDARRFLNQALSKGATLISNAKVEKVVIEKGKAVGVVAKNRLSRRFYPADLVVVSAGGLGTPVILQNSGIPCGDTLFVDPVLCVAARLEGSLQHEELPMPFVVQREHFIISPYFDYLSYFFNRSWRPPASGIYSLMVKLADDSVGSVSCHGAKKRLTPEDRTNLAEGIALCRQILRGLGLRDGDMFLGTLNAGHPGGMLPFTENEVGTFHHAVLPSNLFVADASLLPQSLGNPPILTIAAMAKRVSRMCIGLA